VMATDGAHSETVASRDGLLLKVGAAFSGIAAGEAVCRAGLGAGPLWGVLVIILPVCLVLGRAKELRTFLLASALMTVTIQVQALAFNVSTGYRLRHVGVSDLADLAFQWIMALGPALFAGLWVRRIPTWLWR
jgi:hypothetical protein